MKNAQSESQIQTEFFAVIRFNEAIYPYLTLIRAIPNGGQRHIITAVRLKKEGVVAGTPDVAIWIPSSNAEFKGAFIEFKVPKGKQTPAQIAFRDQVIDKGYDYRVCYSPDEALDFIELYLEVKLQR